MRLVSAYEKGGDAIEFFFKSMTEEDAWHIAVWHYAAPYDFYDMEQDPEDLAELLNPQSWQAPNYAVFNEKHELIGHFSFRQDGQADQAIEIGLGLRPDLTGKGLGRAFISAGLAFGQEHFSVERWSLRVATFNKRAIRLYEQVGFTALDTFIQRTNGGEYEFLRMIRPVE